VGTRRRFGFPPLFFVPSSTGLHPHWVNSARRARQFVTTPNRTTGVSMHRDPRNGPYRQYFSYLE
jgi:hypothetical protein